MLFRSDIALAKSEADIKATRSQIEQYEQEVYKQLNIVQKWILGKEGATLITEIGRASCRERV